MHTALTTALLAGLGGMLGWGISDFFAKKTIDEIGPIKSLVWAHSFGTALLFVVLVAKTLVSGAPPMPQGAGAWLGLVFFGCLQMVVYWLLYEGFGKGQVSILNPIFASYTGVVALIAIIFFGESLHLLTGIALLLLFAGIIGVNLDFSTKRPKRVSVVPGLKEVCIATALAAVWTVGWDRFIGGHYFLPYAFFMYLCMSIAAFILSQIMHVKLGGVDRKLWKFLICVGVGEALAYLAISWGFSVTSLPGVVALISGAFSVPTLILAYLFLKERITASQAVAIGGIILAIILVALG